MVAAQQVGEYLFDLLMPPPILVAFSRAYSILQEGEHLRLRLNVRPPELARLPWELLYNRYEQTFLVTRRTMPLVRFVDSNPSPLTRHGNTDETKSLLVQSNPKDLEPLNLLASELAILKSLGRHSDITTLNKVTPSRLREKLQSERFHIFHYDGHSHLEPDSKDGFLSLEDKNGFTRHLNATELSNYLDGTGIKLVVLASCESSATSQRFIGIAQHLIKANSNIHAVVAMQFSVSDVAAIAFSQGFYKALVTGFPIDIAMSAGRLAVIETINDSESIEWATSVIFMRTNDGNLFNFQKGQQS